MTTNCLPFAIWISVCLSFILICIIYPKRLGAANFIPVAFVCVFIITMMTIFICSVPERIEQQRVKIKIVNTKKETVLLNSNNEVVGIFALNSFTNREKYFNLNIRYNCFDKVIDSSYDF